jgi:glycosyltransferase involved in cell wall biosynthesis
VDGRALLGEPTGVGRYVRNLLREMAAADPGSRFVVFLDREGEDGLPADGRIDRARLPGRRGRNILAWTHLHLPRLMRAHPVAVALFPFYTMPRRIPCPGVLTLHDITFTLHPEWFPLRARLNFAASAPGAARRAAHVLTVSECSRRDIVREYGVDPAKVTAVPLAPDPSFGPRPPDVIEAACRRHGVRRPYLIHLGSLHPRRNLDRLLDAFARVPEARAVQLVLAGRLERPYRTVDPLVRRRGLEARVRHLGYVPEADLPPLVAGAEALVYPSLYEGFGLPVLEAMACGTPVLTSGVSALPETAGGAALLVDPASADAIAEGLASLLRDEGLRARLREAGRARARLFSWRRAAEATLAVFREVAARS